MADKLLHILLSPAIELMFFLFMLTLLLIPGEKSKRTIALTGATAILFLINLISEVYQTNNIYLSAAFNTARAALLISAAIVIIRRLSTVGLRFTTIDKILENLMNTLPHSVIITKLSDEKIIKVNRSFTAISGYTMEEIAGKTTSELKMWPDDSLRIELYRKFRNFEAVNDAEYKVVKKSGDISTVLYNAKVITILGERYVFAHLQVKAGSNVPNRENIKLIREKLETLMSTESLYLNQEITLPVLAERLDTNKYYLSLAINSEHENFSEYINQLRIREACRLIIEGLDPKLTIDHLSSRTGFSSRTTFYEAFRAVTGVSPARFRQINGPKQQQKPS